MSKEAVVTWDGVIRDIPQQIRLDGEEITTHFQGTMDDDGVSRAEVLTKYILHLRGKLEALEAELGETAAKTDDLAELTTCCRVAAKIQIILFPKGAGKDA